MRRNVYRIVRFLIQIVALAVAASCRTWQEPAASSDTCPDIFPDYSEVTIPSNIAPLNFMVEDAVSVQASFVVDGKRLVDVIGREGVIAIPEKKWKALLDVAEGSSVEVQVSVWNEADPEGVRYKPFRIYVSEDEIDPYMAYRLIEPGYMGWRQLGIYQRELSSFEESAIVTNRETNETCLNCHNFPSYSSENMMFHARGDNGGTILYNDGRLTKIDFKNIGPKKNTTYPAWHPEGRYIAFSSNTTHQIFVAEGQKPIEVFDSASDLVLYDIKNGDVVTDPRFMTKDALESFPAWSPDGRHLYFVSAEDVSLDVRFTPTAHYSILRVSFDSESRTFGEKIDTVYNAHSQGGSASYPRISPDGRYLLYTWSAYGTFPIWHDEADLKMIDLETYEEVDVAAWNDVRYADSYHSWSSEGRWVMFGSRRLDGRYTRAYIAYFSEEGKASKPFLLPQEDPRHNYWRLKSYNVPEFIDGKVELPDEAAELFYSEM